MMIIVFFIKLVTLLLISLTNDISSNVLKDVDNDNDNNNNNNNNNNYNNDRKNKNSNFFPNNKSSTMVML